MARALHGSMSSLLMLGLVRSVALGQAPPTETRAPLTPTHSFRVTTVAEGLVNPWSIAFLPDGDILVTERPGRLRVIRHGALDPRPIAGVPQVLATSQGGLLEVVLHPDFESNRLLYLSFTKVSADGTANTDAVVRGRFDGRSLTEVEPVFEARMRPSRSLIAIAARMAFDREGYLYVTVGDRSTPTDGDLRAHVAQDLGTHMGKTVRLHDDGRVPADNPFVGQPGALPEIWSLGHRNAQGIVFHPVTGDLWQSEHSAQGGDELNLIRRGRNYGWPVIGYAREYSGEVLHEGASREGMEQPVHHWTPSIAPSGMMIYIGDLFPNWKGNLFIGALNGEQLSRVIIDGERFVAEEVLLKGALGNIRDVTEGPDGLIYLAIDGERGPPTRIVRLEPEG